MTDPEDPAAKNEQELNLFSDQPAQETPQAEPEFGPDDYASPAPETPAKPDSDAYAATPTDRNGESLPDEISEPEAASAETAPATAAAMTEDSDSPVIAPPPPRKQPPHARPGIVLPRAGRAPFSQSAAAPASAEQNHKPLPHTLQPAQSLGQMLGAIRAARGMSLEEVAIATRIRTEYLIELESDKLLKSLPSVYVSAYVRKLIEVYDLSQADGNVLLDKMHGETPRNSEELPEKLMKEVNEGALVNEGENKRIRTIMIIAFSVIGIIAAALIWLIVLMIVKYAKPSAPAPGRDPAAAESGTAQPAEEPVSRTVRLEESELDALIVPETPSISVLKMSKSPGVRDSL